ncbi:4-alpha-glucanotransferase [Enorma sp.]|uniref:4-alpha-glucanotransferase n=1 Tax=Enorma sp. TaxID=1920692 RepID=UPI0025BAA428|nr:4-alpha-glucanotransferase [Enorma sp.]
MKFIHTSRDTRFRTPFGAVEAGTNVQLSVHAEDVSLHCVSIDLRVWIDGEGELIQHLEHIGDGWFTTTLACPRPALMWYRFNIHISSEDGMHNRYLGAPQGHTGGEGQTYDYADCPSFQITVYKHRKTRPSWYENGMVYQIFPDRYRRDPAWRERCERALVEHPTKGVPRRIVEDWNEPPVYDRAEDGSIASWDMYGGSLKGIMADLDRLKEMGITAIYLNPIFAAASNHRYDTADYLTIDPMLGTEEDFSELCREAEARGISIILDGVFNHTGDDSIYFNRYGTYPEPGAWSGEESPWRDAYRFNPDGSYACWWGIGNMPDFNQDSPLVRKLLVGSEGVIRKWTRLGARGWRLDVADELKESLIADIRQVLLDEKPDALLLGEVWEDASNKISYSQPRHYLLGDELDSAMNYPFRDMVLGFLLETFDAAEAVERIESIRENYPREALMCALNLLGSHDRPRIASLLGGGPDESQLPEEERGRWRLSPESMGLAKSRFWLATLMQMTLMGVPTIYYGDEFCLEGLSDPGNRRTLPLEEDIHDRDMSDIIRNASAIRRALPFMVDGDLRSWVPEGSEGDVLAYERTAADGQSATVLINRSRYDCRTVRIPAPAACATDVVSGAELTVAEDGTVEVFLWPFGSAVVYFHAEERLQLALENGAGVVCHVTSVPTDDGAPGTLGAPSLRFIDHLAAMGMKYWQILPVNPVDAFGSPYSGPSAFAGNIALLPESEEELRADYDAWLASGDANDEDFQAFRREQAGWLDPWCAYMAVKRVLGGTPHTSWPDDLARYDAALLEDERFRDEANVQAYLQYRFECAWREVSAYAHERGIAIIGDVPMYVSGESADVWAEPKLFSLDEDGDLVEVAGAPADAFAPEGQVWGNPTYRWEYMRSTQFAWWRARIERACSLYDYVRLDHFLGFHNYFSIPAGHSGADGRWLAGPGIELFHAMASDMGHLPFIAEDLGVLTPGVRSLMATCGFPGMDVLEFSDYDVREGLHPHPGKIFYTSTHDTTTLAGFCTQTFTDGDEEQGSELASELVRAALESEAAVVMMPLQDVLGLGDDARMNTPGTISNNWSWQAREEDVAAAEASTAALMRETGRTAHCS